VERFLLKQQTKKIQPYSVADGEYAILVEFAIEASRLLDGSYRLVNAWSERIMESVPHESDTTHFSYGEAPTLIQIFYKKSYENDLVDDNVIVTCRGLPEGMHLELRVLKSYHNSPFIEMQVTGPEPVVEIILERFERRFDIEHIPQEREPEYSLRTARAAVVIHAWRAAELNAQQALRFDPINPEAMMYLGIAKAAQGFEPEGEGLLLASLTLNPKNAETYYNLGLIVLKQGRCILASDAFRKGLSIDPYNHPLLYQLGQTLERLGALDEALEVYDRALKYGPSADQVGGLVGMDFTLETKNSIRRIQEMNGN
jgi:tetratricopeptide (TPR) repeat protein